MNRFDILEKIICTENLFVRPETYFSRLNCHIKREWKLPFYSYNYKSENCFKSIIIQYWKKITRIVNLYMVISIYPLKTSYFPHIQHAGGLCYSYVIYFLNHKNTYSYIICPINLKCKVTFKQPVIRMSEVRLSRI